MELLLLVGGIAFFLLFLFPFGDTGMSEKSRLFYHNLRVTTKIPILPPPWLFGIVWYINYILLAVALWTWLYEHREFGLLNLHHESGMDSDDSSFTNLSSVIGSDLDSEIDRKRGFFWSILIIGFVECLLIKIWTNLFFGFRLIRTTLVVTVLIVVLLIVEVVLVSVSPSPVTVASIVCFAIPTLWTVFALIMTSWIAALVSPSEFRSIEPKYMAGKLEYQQVEIDDV